MLAAIVNAFRIARTRAQQILDAKRIQGLLRSRPGYNPARRLKRHVMREQNLSGRQFRIREKQVQREQRRPQRKT